MCECDEPRVNVHRCGADIMRDIVCYCSCARRMDAFPRCVITFVKTSEFVPLRRHKVYLYSSVSTSHVIVAVATVTSVIDMLEILSLLHFPSPRYFVAIDVTSDIAIIAASLCHMVMVVVIAALAQQSTRDIISSTSQHMPTPNGR
jgi:hypothetical protein